MGPTGLERTTPTQLAPTSHAAGSGPRRAPIEALLVLMTLIWGANYSIVKAGLAELPALAFNALRLLIASFLFLTSMSWVAWRERRQRLWDGSEAEHRAGPSLSWQDWLGMAGLGLVGHFLYQLCFMGGLERTSVANSSLILGCSPVAVALLSTAVRHDRLTSMHWVGAGLSLVGIYLVVAHGAPESGASLMGDLLTLGAVLCWATYTVGSRALLRRHSPLTVTGCTMAIGTAFYVPVAVPTLRQVVWHPLSPSTWVGLAFSAVFALCIAYLIWYTAVQKLGNARTAAYSNLVPVSALIVAALWLGEPLDATKVAGAAAVLSGVALTRVGGTGGPPVPAEE